MSRNLNENPLLALAYSGEREKVRDIIINNSLEDAVDKIVQMIADAAGNG